MVDVFSSDVPRYKYSEDFPTIEPQSRVFLDIQLETHQIDDILEEFTGQLSIAAYKNGESKKFKVF